MTELELMQQAQMGAREACAPVCNAMTVDVEDYFQVSAFEPYVDRRGWERRPCRVERNTERVLALFDRHGVRGTFFTLAWVAERYPRLIRRIVDAGHELASHGCVHQRVTALSPPEFREDVRRSKAILEETGGVVVQGYRAPSYSIGAANLWALDLLQEEGYRYSSSVYPIRHDHYGMPQAPQAPFRPRNGGLLEVPIATLSLVGRRLPCGGGGYFRLFPYTLSRWMWRRMNRNEGRAGVFYFHPWEIDPAQPRVAGLSLKTRFRHYLNLSRMEGRLDSLLKDFSWGRMDEVFLHDRHA